MYILTLRSVKRMIAVLVAAFAALCTSASVPAALLLAGRLANATQSLLTLKLTLPSDAARAVVPDLVYRECKALYMMRRPQRGAPAGLRAIAPSSTWGLWRLTLERAAERRTWTVCDYASAADRDFLRNSFSIWF